MAKVAIIYYSQTETTHKLAPGVEEKMLGIAPSKVRTGYAKFDISNPPLNLTLNQVRSASAVHCRTLEYRQNRPKTS